METAAQRRDRIALPVVLRRCGHGRDPGIDEEALDDTVALARGLPPLRLIGFDPHAVSNNLDASAHAGYVVDAVRWSVAAAARFGMICECVNVGGGSGVDYTGGGHFDLAALRGGTHHFRLPAAWGRTRSVSCAPRGTCSPATSGWPGCASATYWSSPTPAG